MNQPVHLDPRRKEMSKPEKATREGILDAAADLIVSDGYGACTMRSISQKVKIKAGSLYYHFASKDEIVVEIMNKGAETLLAEVRRAVEALPENAPFRERLRAAVRVHVSCKLDSEAAYMRVYEHLTPVIKRQGRAVRRKYADFWAALIESGKASGAVRSDLNTRLFIPYVLSGLNRTPEWFNADHMKVDEVAEMILGVILAGIAARG